LTISERIAASLPGRPPRPAPAVASRREPHAPLAGTTIITLELAIAAPLCTRHLADMGARVIKIEQPDVGDSSRYYDDAVRGMAAHFVWLNHGKESVALDLKDPTDVASLRELLRRADVMVSNLAPGTLARLGFDPEQMAATHPRLITVEISGYGHGGPLAGKRAYDLLVQAEAGACAITGLPGRPAKSGIPVADVGTALYALNAVLTALYDRERTGLGTFVSLAMFDVVAELMGFAMNQVIHTGVEPVPVGMGSPMVAPYGAYATHDGRTVVLGTTSDREWRRLAEQLLEQPDLAADPRYSGNVQRIAHRAELDELLSGWCALRDLADIQALADAAGIGNAVLNDVTALVNHPHLARRGRWRRVGSPVGDVPALLPPAVSPHWISDTTGPVPDLGEHTDAVRAELGALSATADEPGHR
jgi:crotonobetainyl-CoA:carnitine CoA-transferase CaiB-like acyl-CoA transferase